MRTVYHLVLLLHPAHFRHKFQDEMLSIFDQEPDRRAHLHLLLDGLLSRRTYAQIPVPVLAIFADPHDFGALYSDNPKAKAALVENDRATTSAQADAFEAGVPSARVVRIPNADHFIFRSNEQQIIREMNAFLATAPR